MGKTRSRDHSGSQGTTRQKRRVTRPTRLVFWVAWALLISAFAFRQVTDVDVWWHMHLGRAALEAGAMPDVSSFYWSPVADPHPIDLHFTLVGDMLLFLIHNCLGVAGLQLLLAACLAASCLMMMSMGRAWHPAAMLFLLCCFLGGTYQLHIVRNALFGLPAIVLLLGLWRWVVDAQRWAWVWSLPLLVGLWRTLHGSYLLGFAALGLLCFGWLLDVLIGRRPGDLKQFIFLSGAFSAAFVAISVSNPLTHSMLHRFTETLAASGGWLWLWAVVGLSLVGLALGASVPNLRGRYAGLMRRIIYAGLVIGTVGAGTFAAIRHLAPFFDDAALANMALRAPVDTDVPVDPGFGARIKHALNQTIWKGTPGHPSSIDFHSPWDYLGDVTVWMSLALWIWAVITLINRRARVTHAQILLFVGVSLLGFGYLRAMGFVAIVSCMLILTLNGPPRILSKPGAAIGLVAVFAALLGMDLSGGTPRLGLDRDHVLGLGPAPFFPAQCADRVLAEYRYRRVLTTIENGGFLLFRWNGEKAVFIDGFFAPHRGRVLDDFNRARTTNDPSALADTYSSDLAIIGLRDAPWIEAMTRHPGWEPRFMDAGCMVFQRQGQASLDFEILIEAETLDHLPKYLQAYWGKALVELLQTWKARGEDAQVAAVTHRYRVHLEAIRDLLAE